MYLIQTKYFKIDFKTIKTLLKGGIYFYEL